MKQRGEQDPVPSRPLPEAIRTEEFGLRDDIIYLNHAGVSPWPIRTSEAVRRFADDNVAAGSLHYPLWLDAEHDLRRQLRDLLHAPSADDIALLKNTSEALSVVAYGIAWREGDNVVSTDQEFPSNRIVWQSLQSRGVEFREAPIGNTPEPEEAILSLVDDRTRIVTVSSVQFGTGLRMDLERIGAFCEQMGILFCVDAIQSIGAVDVDVQRIRADFVMADGHKWMLGPEGLAVFYCRSSARDLLGLNQYGWHMVEEAGNFDVREWTIAKSARRFECGSPNMLGAQALRASLSLIIDIGIGTIEENVLAKSSFICEWVLDNPALELVTPFQPGRFAGIVTFRLKDGDPSELHCYLRERGVICAIRHGGIRFSPHFYTPAHHIEKALGHVDAFVRSQQ
ncbi:MAG TPA: aminotransferase class V-fold PLP-dependent enzyme [Dissulfurispiraceae bacterium]|nr:aminotransferase class V-fold PLP-dependent enzyme [Dissulfurispiraceae bacterium]